MRVLILTSGRISHREQAERFRRYSEAMGNEVTVSEKAGDLSRFDSIVCLWWHSLVGQTVPRGCGCEIIFNDHSSWCGHKDFKSVVKQAESVFATNRVLADELGRAGVLWVKVLPDNVDGELFRCRESNENRGPLIVGCVTDSTIWAKNGEFIRELPKHLGSEVDFRVIDAAGSSALPFDRMPEWYRGLDLLLVPSFSEGTGFACLEALASGVPVWSTPTGIAKSIAPKYPKAVKLTHFEPYPPRIGEELRELKRESLASPNECRAAVEPYLFKLPKMRARVASPRHLERWVSLASIPSRVDLLRQTVNSLLPQVDRLNVYLNGYETVPEFLRQSRITVARSQETGDVGDAGKFYWVGECLGYYLTADDDIVYPPNYVQTLVDAIEDRGRMAVLGFHGNVLPADFTSFYKDRVNYRFGRVVEADVPVHVLGTGVCGFHRSTLELAYADFKAPNMADVWLMKRAREQGVPLVVLAHEAGWIVPQKVPSGIYETHQRDPGKQDEILRALGFEEAPKDVPSAAVGSLAKRKRKVVSTLVSAFNTPKEWLLESVNSVLGQTLPEGWRHEVWVAFDGSEVLDLPPGVGVTVTKGNHGPYAQANLLAALASGEYLVRVDSDDRVMPERTERLLKVCPEGGAAGSDWVDSSVPGERHTRAAEGTWLWSREAFEKLGGFASWRCAADTDALHRAERLGIPMGRDEAQTYWRRSHDGQLTKAVGTGFGSGLRGYYTERIRKSLATYREAFIPLEYRVVKVAKLLKSRNQLAPASLAA